MKLLLDQNLSRFLVDSLAPFWPDSSHVALRGLEKAADRQLWEFAAKNGYCLVSKDTDFFHLALLHGAPPKVIMIKTGNVSTSEARHCLLAHREVIDTFLADANESVLVIP